MGAFSCSIRATSALAASRSRSAAASGVICVCVVIVQSLSHGPTRADAAYGAPVTPTPGARSWLVGPELDVACLPVVREALARQQGHHAATDADEPRARARLLLDCCKCGHRQRHYHVDFPIGVRLGDAPATRR